jgi:uncharacterized protein (TIGR02145 family)
MRQGLFFLMIFMIVRLQAQTYQISFAGKGASLKVDSVKVENLKQCKELSLGGSDILNLTLSSGINIINNNSDKTCIIYPNPSADNCIIEFEENSQTNSTLELYDITGKRILKIQELLKKGKHKFRLSGTGSGIYMLKVESSQSGFIRTAKIISCNLNKGVPEIKHIETSLFTDKQQEDFNSETDKSYKGIKSIKDMQFSQGDILKLTGYSDNYRTISILMPAASQTVTFDFILCTDGDNNNYAVVQIGTQLWMGENLKTTKYNDGSAITNVTDNKAWMNLTTPAYCWYNNDASANKNVFGGLYNWYAVNTGKLCPVNWHVPNDIEWTAFGNILGGLSIAGGKMKETCSDKWQSPNTGATNESGFSALPAGGRDIYVGIFSYIAQNGYWWSATEFNTTNAYYRYLYYNYKNLYTSNISKGFGFPVRCIKN